MDEQQSCFMSLLKFVPARHQGCTRPTHRIIARWSWFIYDMCCVEIVLPSSAPLSSHSAMVCRLYELETKKMLVGPREAAHSTKGFWKHYQTELIEKTDGRQSESSPGNYCKHIDGSTI